MLGLDILAVEEILDSLDENNYIFSQYKLYKQNQRPCLLGKGGFSYVYEVYNKDEPKKHYALKVLGFDKHTLSLDVFNRTIDLQRIISRQCEHVARIIDAKAIRVILDEDGKFADAMEEGAESAESEGVLLQFVLMEKLETILAKDRFGKVTLKNHELQTEDGIVEFAKQIGEAIKTAHYNNVLHRDIKLENIFWNAKTGKYVLGDFGIAKFVENGTAETMVYTDGYGAPEIERRLVGRYSATADIYSYGVTLYLLLNGLCFPASETYRVNPIQYSQDYVFPAPKNATVPMTRIVQKMCCYNSEERYSSMEAVLTDLEQVGKTEETADDNTVYPDFETVTYRDSQKISRRSHNVELSLTSRAKRKELAKKSDKFYGIVSVLLAIGMALATFFIVKGDRIDVNVFTSPWFWLLPLVVIIQAVFVRIKELYVLFGMITIGLIVYSAISLEFTLSHVVLLLSVVCGMPLAMLSVATGVGMWILTSAYALFPGVDFIERFELVWIAESVLFILINENVWLKWNFDKIKEKSVVIWDRLYLIISLLMIIAGMVMGLVQYLQIFAVPEILQQIHPGRVGFVLLVVHIIRNWMICRSIEADKLEEEDVTA